MLLETIHFATALLLSKRRHPDEIREAVSLWSRARRCKKAWAEHEKNCLTFITNHIGQMPSRNTVVVLGSGLCRDIPLRALSLNFQRVILLDLVHLPSVRLSARLKRLKNVRFIQSDLIEDPSMGFLNKVKNLDLVISANVLSQMVLDLEENGYPDKATEAAKAHLDSLFKGSWQSCLLTDTGYETHYKDDRESEYGELLAGVKPPSPDDQWQWPVVPFGEVDNTHETIHNVIAVWKAPGEKNEKRR